MFVAFGLWNVLLLPFSIEELGATEFEYGLQEGLTSVGFVVGSLFMARFARRAAGTRVDRRVADRDGHRRDRLRLVDDQVSMAILLVTISGFLQPPSSVSRSVLLQRNTPREMRGRVFSAFYVMRDVIFLFGMAGAGLADVVDIRLLIIIASSLLFVSAAFTLVAPGLGCLDLARRLGAAEGGGRGRHGPRRHAAATGDPGRLRSAGGPRLGVRPAHRRPSARRSSPRRSSARSRRGPGSWNTATSRRRRTSSSTVRPRPASRMRAAIAASRRWAPATSSVRSRP